MVDARVEALKALGNPTRFQLMEWLRSPSEAFAEFSPDLDPDEFGVCVSHLAAKAGLAQSTISTYMAALESAGLVTSRRMGKWTYYRRNSAGVEDLIGNLGARI